MLGDISSEDPGRFRASAECEAMSAQRVCPWTGRAAKDDRSFDAAGCVSLSSRKPRATPVISSLRWVDLDRARLASAVTLLGRTGAQEIFPPGRSPSQRRPADAPPNLGPQRRGRMPGSTKQLRETYF